MENALQVSIVPFETVSISLTNITTTDDEARHGPNSANATQTARFTTTTIPNTASKDVKAHSVRTDDVCPGGDTNHGTRLRSSRMFKGKGLDVAVQSREQSRPLQLLDLPVDILEEIVGEVTHTNDLTSLALCHSALHRLAIPHIYSRFDIVWPDNTATSETRSGVDALTYGLATLVMAEEVFDEAPSQNAQLHQNRFITDGHGFATERQVRRRRGNHYAQYTKKFSLGNGPADWVQEYLINKEGGKMLGTLVALAVARMRSLEAFIWDMPTGIIQDVWTSLASLGDRRGPNEQQCRLEKVWVRWHNNALDNPAGIQYPSASIHTRAPSNDSNHDSHNNSPFASAQQPMDRSSFSHLPPLKSLSVLDIDELKYLDEMSVLIGNSVQKLRELRIGVARHAMTREWVTVRESEQLQQVDPRYPTHGSLTIGAKRLGGVLGILTGFVQESPESRIAFASQPVARHMGDQEHPHAEDPDNRHDCQNDPSSPDQGAAETSTLSGAVVSQLEDVESSHSPTSPSLPTRPTPSSSEAGDYFFIPTCTPEAGNERVQPASLTEARKLCLETLELERVPLSVPILRQNFDWTKITSLTILNCLHHEQLWKMLRKEYAPVPKSPIYPQPRRTPGQSPRKQSKTATGEADFHYPLKLKKVHTSTVSPALITFLKETLAPNTLEVLFLQEALPYMSTVEMASIYRGPIRRHRSSLCKLMIDSSEKSVDHVSSSHWRRWMLKGEMLSFICAGKMPRLRELSVAMDYRDWHFFLQHLPAVPQLRSLFIPHIDNNPHCGANINPQELALQIVDIVALRPDIELCYMGIANKCFEILETRHPSAAAVASLEMRALEDDEDDDPSQLGAEAQGGVAASGEDDGADDDDAEDDDEEEEGEEGEGATESEGSGDEEDEADEDEDEQDDDDDYLSSDDECMDGGQEVVARVRLREILFYDDKVAIFKARHGKL